MMIYTENSKPKPIKGYIWWTIVELAERGYISEEQSINQEFLDKIKLEELVNIEKIGEEVKRRLE